jgi:hypothetical protein
MSIITSRVQIQKRYWESPLNEERKFGVYKWEGSISTADEEYLTQVPIKFKAEDVESQKPTEESLMTFAAEDGYSATSYYLCEFQMSDFGLHKKVSTDAGCDETGKEYFIDLADAKYYAYCKNPLSLIEDEEPAMYIEKLIDGTLHLNCGFELLAELEEREYEGKIWAVVADNCC